MSDTENPSSIEGKPSAGAPAAAGQLPSTPDAAGRLGVEPVGKLLLRFSIPAITGMLVNALYIMVDRIFIGQAINELALGGLSLVMPLMTVSMAFAMLFGFGAANMISMRLGQGRKADAENALAHCFFLLLGFGLLTTVLGLVFLEPLLGLLGAQEGSEAIGYARSYFRIILYSTVFGMLGFGFSHCTRAQGFPAVTMIALLIGAVLNIIFDALFILVFKWGIEGAGWATVIAQGVSMVWILRFSLSKRAVVRLKLSTFKPSASIAGQIMSFGSAHFLFQITGSGVQFLYNKSMVWYGTAALGVANGSDIALSGTSIIMVIQMLIFMPILGINQGAQPLLGYNYGAKKFGRVLQTFRLAVIAGTVVCIIGFAAVMLFPNQLVRIFVSGGDPALLYFTPRAMRTMMLMLPILAFLMMSTTFFVVTGRPKMTTFLALLRTCLILVPLMLIFGRIWGLWGVFAAGPVSEALALVVTSIIISLELKKLINAKERTV